MTTIDHFERALGRKALWAARYRRRTEDPTDEYVQRLRIYPHALRMANAYYSRDKGALLFGYFPGTEDAVRPVPRRVVSPACRTTSSRTKRRTRCSTDSTSISWSRPIRTCSRSTRRLPTSSRCSSTSRFPRCSRTRSRRRAATSAARTCSAQLAAQFGHARGTHGALRDAIGKYDPTHEKWVKHDARSRRARQHASSCTRAARSWWRPSSTPSFDLSQRASRDLLRLATGGTGVLPRGRAPPRSGEPARARRRRRRPATC